MRQPMFKHMIGSEQCPIYSRNTKFKAYLALSTLYYYTSFEPLTSFTILLRKIICAAACFLGTFFSRSFALLTKDAKLRSSLSKSFVSFAASRFV